RLVDLRARGELVVDLARILDLARAVDRDEPAGLAVAAHVEGEHGELAVEPLRDGGQVLPLPAEAVEEHDRGVAGGRRRVGRLVERRGEVDADARPAAQSATSEMHTMKTTRRPKAAHSLPLESARGFPAGRRVRLGRGRAA